jgi:hypothetical protein
VIEVAKLWGLSENTIRRMFTGEPGVVEWVAWRAGSNAPIKR